ncbi:MAG: hypothetical protein HYV33_05730 [Candidatus Kerfeldbacteria bacterium]|nr:hypothetical protein [Candidatus Kerfeldbacteria bacterium]
MIRKKFTKTQQQFIQRFIDMLYYSMEIEGEAPYTKREFYTKYHHHAVDLINDGSYKNVKL